MPVANTDISYDSKTARMLTQTELNEPLEATLLNLWDKICAKGYVEIESACQLNYLYKAGGAHWLTSVLIKALMNVSYQDDLAKQTELMKAIFHIDIEQTTLALLLYVIPQYLQCKKNREKLTDPRGSALAKLVVGCLFTILSAKKDSISSSGKLKRPLEEIIEDEPSAKMRKLAQGSSEMVKDHKESKLDEPINEGMAAFFKMIYAVILCQVRFLLILVEKF